MTNRTLVRSENPTDDLAVPTEAELLEQAVNSVLDSVSSEHTRRAYRRALTGYLAWRAGDPSRRILNKANIQAYRRYLETEGGEKPSGKFKPSISTGKPMGAASINLRLSAIRKLAREVADNSTDPGARVLAEAVSHVEGIRREGQKLHNWLQLSQAETMINTPDIDTLSGLRDRALLAVLIGAGLRRTEAAQLEIGHIQQRAGRWVIVDLVGKRGKVRSIPIAPWIQAAIVAWTTRAGLTTGRLFCPVAQRDQLTERSSMSAQALYEIVDKYAKQCGFGDESPNEARRGRIAPHDLRRSYARLARSAGASVDQISVNLGHSNLAVTSRYLGTDLDLVDAPSDRIAIRLEHRRASASADSPS